MQSSEERKCNCDIPVVQFQLDVASQV